MTRLLPPTFGKPGSPSIRTTLPKLQKKKKIGFVLNQNKGEKKLNPGIICHKPHLLSKERRNHPKVIPSLLEACSGDACACLFHWTADPTWEVPEQSTAWSRQIWPWRALLSWAAVSRGKPSGWDRGREPVAAEPRARFPSVSQKLACAGLFRRALPCVEGEGNYLPCQWVLRFIYIPVPSPKQAFNTEIAKLKRFSAIRGEDISLSANPRKRAEWNRALLTRFGLVTGEGNKQGRLGWDKKSVEYVEITEQ